MRCQTSTAWRGQRREEEMAALYCGDCGKYLGEIPGDFDDGERQCAACRAVELEEWTAIMAGAYTPVVGE